MFQFEDEEWRVEWAGASPVLLSDDGGLAARGEAPSDTALRAQRNAGQFLPDSSRAEEDQALVERYPELQYPTPDAVRSQIERVYGDLQRDVVLNTKVESCSWDGTMWHSCVHATLEMQARPMVFSSTYIALAVGFLGAPVMPASLGNLGWGKHSPSRRSPQSSEKKTMPRQSSEKEIVKPLSDQGEDEGENPPRKENSPRRLPLVLHADEYYRPQAFARQNVVIVGWGASSVEIAADLALRGENVTVTLVVRDTQLSWILSRRLQKTKSLLANGSLLKLEERHKSIGEEMEVLHGRAMEKINKQTSLRFVEKPLDSKVMLSEAFLDAMEDDRIKVMEGEIVRSMEGPAVVIRSTAAETILPCDAILCCTGYEPPVHRVGRLLRDVSDGSDKSFLNSTNSMTLLETLWCPDIPNAAFLGFVYGFTCLPRVARLQAEILVGVLTKKLDPLDFSKENVQFWNDANAHYEGTSLTEDARYDHLVRRVELAKSNYLKWCQSFEDREAVQEEKYPPRHGGSNFSASGRRSATTRPVSSTGRASFQQNTTMSHTSSNGSNAGNVATVASNGVPDEGEDRDNSMAGAGVVTGGVDPSSRKSNLEESGVLIKSVEDTAVEDEKTEKRSTTTTAPEPSLKLDDIQRLRWTAVDQSTRWKLYNDWAANYEADTRLFDSPYAVRDCVLSCLQWLESEECRHDVDTGQHHAVLRCKNAKCMHQ